MQNQFEKAHKQLRALSVAVEKRESYMRQTLLFYKARQYEWAMHYQFLFLEWQDEVNVLGDKTINTDAHKLWFLIGGRP
jgi:hypothetical protein